MASGKRGTKRALEKVQSRQISHDPQESDKENLTAERNDDDRVIEIEPPPATESHPSQNKPSLPLHSEIIKGTGKKWTCKHFRKSFTSSYTRIHHHFFGAPAEQKCDIARCNALLSNKSELLRIRAMVEEVESNGNHQSLTRSTIQNSNLLKLTQKSPIVDSFGALERHQIDVLVVRALCANGIPFNVLRNPEMINMFKAVARGPSDYKPPSFDRARTTLLDEVHREVDKELALVKDTWITHGTSIVSDGWSNIKNQPLINVIASNSRGSTFLYADDFSGVEKSGKNIADYLLKSVDDIGPKNVLQIVTDNASNCRAAGKQIEKVLVTVYGSYG